MDAEWFDRFRQSVSRELLNNILPFWLTQVDQEKGGFYGRISNDLLVKLRSPKGLVLTARILWTFSAAYRRFGQHAYFEIAQKAYHLLINSFWDQKYGGMYWLLDADYQPTDVSKKIYGQAFSIYGLVEYYAATQCAEALERAKELYHLIERYTYDAEYEGYFESCNRDWTPTKDFRLSEIDLNEKKSMNSHLHLLEAYTQLFRFWPDKQLREQLGRLINNFLQHILDPNTFHFHLFFDEQWQVKSDRVSFGHDIEGSWLLTEAAAAYGDELLRQKLDSISVRMAKAVLEEAMSPLGGIIYERSNSGQKDEQLHWWPQTEAVVGFFNAYQISGNHQFAEASWRVWQFCENYLVDRKYGEWFYKVLPDGTPDWSLFKVSEWKCPYHNGRACMEIIDRIEKIKSSTLG